MTDRERIEVLERLLCVVLTKTNIRIEGPTRFANYPLVDASVLPDYLVDPDELKAMADDLAGRVENQVRYSD